MSSQLNSKKETPKKINEAKFMTSFIISEVDKAIELAGEQKPLINQLNKIKELLS